MTSERNLSEKVEGSKRPRALDYIYSIEQVSVWQAELRLSIGDEPMRVFRGDASRLQAMGMTFEFDGLEAALEQAKAMGIEEVTSHAA